MIASTSRMETVAVIVVVALLAPHTSATPFRFGSKKRDQADPSSSPSPVPPPPAFPATDGAGLGGLGNKGDTGVLLPPIGADTGLGGGGIGGGKGGLGLGGQGGLGLGGAGETGFFAVVDGIDDGIDVLMDGGIGLGVGGGAGGLDASNTLFVKDEAVLDNPFSTSSQEITALVPASTTSIFNRAGQRTPCMRVYRLAKNLKGRLFQRGNRRGNRGGRGRRFGEEVLGRILCLIPDSLRASRRRG